MKKIIYLVLIAITISCSSSDEKATNKIVGSWKEISSTKQTGTNGTPTNDFNYCRTIPTYVFTQNGENDKNGSLTYQNIYQNESGDCVNSGNATSSWTDLGSNTYTIGSPDALNVTFTNSNKTMLVVSIDGPYVFKSTYSKQ